jgi:hypothetical protein
MSHPSRGNRRKNSLLEASQKSLSDQKEEEQLFEGKEIYKK